MSATLGIALGKRIKELRERAQLTQADLAQIALKSVETISNFERGKTIPSVRTLVESARHIDCEVSDFFNSSEVGRPSKAAPQQAVINKLKLLNAEDRALLIAIADVLVARRRQ